MEGVHEKLHQAMYNTFLIDFGIRFTNAILDSGAKPSVISAIMKQQTTERGKNVIINGMDVHGGSAICQGPNNFISKFYKAGPIGITVEGSNVLTRSLIIFGQGLNKSHPHISSVVEAIQTNNKSSFYSNLGKMSGHMISKFFQSTFKTIIPVSNPDIQLKKNTLMFSNLSNLISLMGGDLKRKQMISGHMADMFSQLYLGYAISYHEQKFNIDYDLYYICKCELNKEFHKSFMELKKIVPKYIYALIMISCREPDYNIIYPEDKYIMSNLIWKNDKLKKYVEEQIYTDNNILGNIKKAMETTDTDKREKLIDNIISVGEYKIKNT